MRPRLSFSPAQVRAARGLLDLPSSRLADMAGLETEAVELYEAGQGELADDEFAALAQALYAEGWGVIAIPAHDGGEGVRFARPLGGNAMLQHRSTTGVPTMKRERGDGDW